MVFLPQEEEKVAEGGVNGGLRFACTVFFNGNPFAPPAVRLGTPSADYNLGNGEPFPIAKSLPDWKVWSLSLHYTNLEREVIPKVTTQGTPDSQVKIRKT